MAPFDLSRTLPVGGGLLVLYSLPRPPVVKQLMQMVTMVPRGGQFPSVCFSNRIKIHSETLGPDFEPNSLPFNQ